MRRALSRVTACEPKDLPDFRKVYLRTGCPMPQHPVARAHARSPVGSRVAVTKSTVIAYSAAC